jgi:hypothetical protein
MPGLRIENRASWEPRISGETFDPSTMTEMTMISIPTSAKLDARESLDISRYNERGYDMPRVQIVITNCLDTKKPRKDLSRPGKMYRITWGIVSPKNELASVFEANSGPYR